MESQGIAHGLVAVMWPIHCMQGVIIRYDENDVLCIYTFPKIESGGRLPAPASTCQNYTLAIIGNLMQLAEKLL